MMELFIINDGNGTIEIDVNDSRIHLFENERQPGANGAGNTGIFKSSGGYIAFVSCCIAMVPTVGRVQGL